MKNIRKDYDTWAGEYDSQKNVTRDLDSVVLKNFEDLIKGKKVLECGCGTGKNTQFLVQHAKEVIGLDFSEGMLNIAREKVKEVSFFQHDLSQRWPFEDNKFDLVLFNLVLEHIESINFLFFEASRVLVEGGNLLLSEYHPSKVQSGKGAVIKLEEKELGIPNFFHSEKDFMNTLEKNGFELVEKKDWFKPEGEKEMPQILTILGRKE